MSLWQRSSTTQTRGQRRSGDQGAAPDQRGGGQLRRRRPAAGVRFGAYWVNHLQALFHSLGRMVRNPVSSLMTVAVIGIALALPTGLHVILQNLQGMSSGWENTAQISLFLRRDIGAGQVDALMTRLQGMPEVAAVSRITPDEALAEFRQLSGFDAALETLGDNPLPMVLVIRPKLEFNDPLLVETLLQRLRELPGVELAQLDMEWVRRLFALMDIGKRGVLVLGVLLSLAVLLIVGNTIRLAIESRREEIEVQKLIGATDAFIRRPFLYSGFWHGLGGAVVAWLLVNLSLMLLSGPVHRLSLLYDSSLELQGTGLAVTVLLLVSGMGLGLLGAWLAVGRHLRAIEPA